MLLGGRVDNEPITADVSNISSPLADFMSGISSFLFFFRIVFIEEVIQWQEKVTLWN
jgi:hypothetical protein